MATVSFEAKRVGPAPFTRPELTKGDPNLALVFCMYILGYNIFVLLVNVRFCCTLCLVSSALTYETGWEECLQNDLFCMELDDKP